MQRWIHRRRCSETTFYINSWPRMQCEGHDCFIENSESNTLNLPLVNVCSWSSPQVQNRAAARVLRPVRCLVPSFLSPSQASLGPTSPALLWSIRPPQTLGAPPDTLRWSRVSLRSHRPLQTQPTITCCRWKPQGSHLAACWSTHSQVGGDNYNYKDISV